MIVLIVGGSSGLGLELAKQLASQGNKVIISGRHNPKQEYIEFHKFNLTTGNNLTATVTSFIEGLPKIDMFVYAAGYYQEGTIVDLSQEEIKNMLNVGIHAPVWLIKELLTKQNNLNEFVAITSTSHWTPREKEPIYTAVKAALGHFANSISLDKRVKKTLVVGPAGMRTNFWSGIKRDDLNEMLEPTWVAEQIIKLLKDNYQYRFAKIMRQPPRVVIEETR